MFLAACGGGGGGDSGPIEAPGCDVASQNAWLRGYMSDWYYWSGASPDPDPAAYTTVATYFDALRYAGSGNVPSDRWSYIEDSAAYSQFFEEGRTLGYGVFVNGLEMVLPLKLRYVEPQSPAAAAGLKRGDVIVSINGRSAAELMASGDFEELTPADEGEVLTVVIEEGVGTRSVALTAATYDLTPVSVAKVLPLPDGRKAGYLVLKDFITQAEAPLAEAFAEFRAEGATDLILDLRYNGGGRVSTSGALASMIAGAGHAGGVFARLIYNDRHRDADKVYSLASAPGPALQRVVILTGPRTCSASELVVNGLKPFVDVVTIGDATCGKPFGFSPVESCGSTFSAVNFESFNGAGAGGYYDGIAQTCAAEDDFSGELGDAAETLTAAATSYLDTGACAPVAAARDRTAAAVRLRAQRGPEPGDRQGMIVD
ncbi:S41 family peptidase [Piscinibacter sp.]|uniref:S41 family peptidase n=1 Tax=Piscinibacter sp. TaxID=1903157 RepID=UPI002B9B9EEB|nr:S41 family peptidase [Albitalea sp.]HUG23126.1 S41 family peptidase [Albitalea sp.]